MTPNVTNCSGNGQGSCTRCNELGKWNVNWMCFFYRIEGYEGIFCQDCKDYIISHFNEKNN